MIVSIAYADIRNAQPAADTVYFMTDPGRQGFWYQHLPAPGFLATNTTLQVTPDDNGWCSITLANGVVVRRDLVAERPRLSWAGILPTNAAAQNADAFTRFIGSLKEMDETLPAFYLAAGSYRLGSYTILPGARPLRLVGEGVVQFLGAGTTLLEVSYDGGYYENILFNGFAPLPVPVDAAGNPSRKHADYHAHSLVKVHGVTGFRYCEFIRSSGHGLYATGHLDAQLGNSSNSVFEHCKFRENKGAGRYVGELLENGESGPLSLDANHMLFLGCDQRNNELEGFVDDSFLGCVDIASHNNDNTLGNFKVRGSGNRAVLLGSYEEDPNPHKIPYASQFLGYASVLGSRIYGQPEIGNFVFYNDAHIVRSIQTPKLHITAGGVPFADNSGGLLFQGAGDSAPIIALQSAGDVNKTLYQMVNLNEQLLPILQIYGSNTQVPVPGASHTRTSATNGINLARFREGNLEVVYVEQLSDLQTDKELRARDWLPGDELRPYVYDRTKPQYLLCTQGGKYNASFPVTIHGELNPSSGGGVLLDIDNVQYSDYLPLQATVEFVPDDAANTAYRGVGRIVGKQNLYDLPDEPTKVTRVLVFLEPQLVNPSLGIKGTIRPPAPVFVGVVPQTVPWP